MILVVRAMKDTLKKSQPPREPLDEHGICPDHNESGSGSHNHRRQTSCPKAISLPSSPQKYKLEGNFDLITTGNNSIGNDPWFPYHEWNIDYSELTVGSRVGIGFFGEVFRGTWNGIEVAIKVLLEQEVSTENIEDFCNEISILSRLRHPNGMSMTLSNFK
ncbi:serine/threonine-protein kinase EDR1-like [Bidens hawaiensis]|uniref:serine/threonine-protein kinase EDR1-like n=1 Tax=Bidens hawaiensis TaxID=980011 RepID=UPI004049A403